MMKQAAWCLVLIVALTVIWHPAIDALTGVFDVSLVLRSLCVGFIGGLLVGLFVAYAWIYNRLVEADRRREMDRVNAKHDGRRIAP